MSTFADVYQEAEAAIGGPELEYLHLGWQLQADATYIDSLVKAGKQAEATEYVRSSRFLERRDAWRRGQAQ